MQRTRAMENFVPIRIFFRKVIRSLKVSRGGKTDFDSAIQVEGVIPLKTRLFEDDVDELS